MPKAPGQTLREAWIAGVLKHHPGTPSPGCVATWEEIPDWERQCAASTERDAVLAIATFREELAGLTDDARAQFIAHCWIVAILANVPDPKASLLTPWEELPVWQRKTDLEIFYALEDVALNYPADQRPRYS